MRKLYHIGGNYNEKETFLEGVLERSCEIPSSENWINQVALLKQEKFAQYAATLCSYVIRVIMD